MRALLRDTIAIFIMAVVIFFLLQATVGSVIVVGASMEPGLQEGQRLLINKVVYNFHPPERGDVIVFQRDNQQMDYIKRIIGLPGESVEIKNGTVYIHQNGKAFPLDEPYINDLSSDDFQGDIIPENEYFVLGDNRNNSNDSRNGWTAKREDIIGKAWFKIWPPSTWGLALNYSLQEQLASY